LVAVGAAPVDVLPFPPLLLLLLLLLLELELPPPVSSGCTSTGVTDVVWSPAFPVLAAGAAAIVVVAAGAAAWVGVLGDWMATGATAVVFGAVDVVWFSSFDVEVVLLVLVGWVVVLEAAHAGGQR
jgi:hypothetical protein